MIFFSLFLFRFVSVTLHLLQAESNERRSRRDMSPQGRKRASAMVARDCRTVSGIGQSYHNNQVYGNDHWLKYSIPNVYSARFIFCSSTRTYYLHETVP